MVASKIHHERSLPNTPQTNACAARFHRTLAERHAIIDVDERGSLCVLDISVFVPNGARHFFGVQVRLEFLPVLLQPDGQSSPFELPFGRPYNVESLHPFGSARYFLEEQHLDKFEPRGRLGVVLGYGRLHSYGVRDFEHYTPCEGEDPHYPYS